MKKVIFGFLFMSSLVISASNSYDEDFKTCGEWAADVLSVIEEEQGCMTSKTYNIEYASLVNYCFNNMQ